MFYFFRWDPPSDDGGSPVDNYILEIDGGQGWQTVYQVNISKILKIKNIIFIRGLEGSANQADSHFI